LQLNRFSFELFHNFWENLIFDTAFLTRFDQGSLEQRCGSANVFLPFPANFVFILYTATNLLHFLIQTWALLQVLVQKRRRL
jgi:hypothetical protein